MCALFSTVDPAATVFNPVLTQWIKTFYSVAVVQSTLTTGLMAYRIWATDRRTAIFRTARSHLMPIFRILLESASLLLFVEVLLLSLYLANYNAQYILLEIITPTVVSRSFVLGYSAMRWLILLSGHHVHRHYSPHLTPSDRHDSRNLGTRIQSSSSEFNGN